VIEALSGFIEIKIEDMVEIIKDIKKRDKKFE